MNKLSSLLGGAAVIAIAVVFVLQFRPASSARTTDTGPTCVAEVHGTCISTNTFWAAFKMLTSRLNEGKAIRGMRMRQQTADGLIEAQLLVDDAKRLGLAISDDDVSREFVTGRVHLSLPAKEIRDIAPRLYLADPVELIQLLPVKGKSKKFETKQFEKVVRQATHLSPTDFRDWQKTELLAARMRDLVRSRVRVGDDEVFEQFSREKSTATIDYVKFDFRWYTLIVDATPDKVKEWADKNQDTINSTWEKRKTNFMPECRVTRHILVKVDETVASDADKASAKKRIDQAAERIKQGEDFADVAKDMSEDAAPRGGELGCVAKGQMVKPFEDAMLALDAGKVSDVVTSQFGYHLIKVEKIAKGEEAEKIGREQTTRELYIAHEAASLATEGAKEIQLAVRGGKPMKEALQAYLDHTIPKVEKKADKKKKKKKGDDAAPAEKTDEKADNGGHEAETAENSPLKPALDTSLPFTVTGDPIPGTHGLNDVAKIAFALKAPGDVPDDVVAFEGGYAVIQLKEKTPATREEFEKGREFYLTAMRNYKQGDALVAYMKRLSANLGPEAKPNATLVTEPKPAGSGEPQGPDGPPEQPEEDE